MEFVANPVDPDKVILIHNGALGDFFVLWPAACSLAVFSAGARLFWAGASSLLPWLAPLGYRPCPPPQRRALDALYSAATPPEALIDHRVFWPVLDKDPPVPPSDTIHILRGIPGSGSAHVRDNYLKALARLGIPAAPDWSRTFRGLFAQDRRPGDAVLLFPGSGHPLKCWPMVKFFELAGLLGERGLRPVFVLGPAELERGLEPAGYARLTPRSPEELADALLRARAVVGGDCGPMHLAGMLGVPGVSLFGPTDFAQWGPLGMARLGLDLPCSPCTRTCADLDCSDPRCLKDIPAGQALQALQTVRAAEAG